MLPDLLTYAPTVTAEFHLSLAEDVIISLRLLRAVEDFEGLSEWVYQTAATLPDGFRSELDILGYPIKWCFQRQDSLIWRLSSDHPAHADMDAFCTYLEATPATDFQRVLLLNLSRDAGEPHPPATPDDITLSHMLATCAKAAPGTISVTHEEQVGHGCGQAAEEPRHAPSSRPKMRHIRGLMFTELISAKQASSSPFTWPGFRSAKKAMSRSLRRWGSMSAIPGRSRSRSPP